MPTALPPQRALHELGRAGGAAVLRERGVSGKAWRLDLARERGLPVPAAWLVVDGTYRRLRAQATVVGPDDARAAILRGARRAVAEGRLPAPDDVWLLTADEVRALGEGATWTADDVERRRGLRASWAALGPADAFRRSEAFAGDGGGAGSADRWVGMGLAPGVVEGIAWVASRPDERPPAERADGPRILVAPAIEAGWIPSVLAADAIAVDMGGELSHGSILLRELGKPAVTAAQGVFADLRTGDVVRLDGATGEIVRLGRAQHR